MLREGETITLMRKRKQTKYYMKRKLLMLLLIALGISTISSCLPLAVGAAAGYVAHDEGYRVQNPIKKTGD